MQNYILNLEDLQYRLSCAISLVRAVEGCMRQEGWETDALLAAYVYLSSLGAELEQTLAAAKKEQ